MKTKAITTIMTILLLASMLSIAIPLVNASPAELHVGPGQTYADIQDAINAANPGDTILVHPGTYGKRLATPPGWGGAYYAPPVIVYKDDLVIRAVDPDPSNTIILNDMAGWYGGYVVYYSTGGAVNPAGPDIYDGSVAPSAVIIIADGVTIEGFTIQSTYIGDPGQTWHPNTAGVFIGGLYAGDLQFEGVDGATIKNNVISGWSAVYNWKSPDNTYISNEMSIIPTTTAPIGAGINVWDGWNQGNPAVSSNNLKIVDNTITVLPLSTGISLGGMPIADRNALIEHNTISGGSTGISVWNSEFSEVINTNTISASSTVVYGPSGIFIGDSMFSGAIYNNLITSGYDGVKIANSISSGAIINTNMISIVPDYADYGGVGIEILQWGSGTSTFSGVISSNMMSGMPNVFGISIRGTMFSGDISTNTITSAYVGINIRSDTFLGVISTNTISGGSYGINLRDNAPLSAIEVSNNVISGTDTYGIRIKNSDNVAITANIIQNNVVGVLIDTSKNAVAHCNTITGSSDWGMQNIIGSGDPMQWVVDATLNWWGDPSGPYHPTSWTYDTKVITNPHGKGDKVSDYVLYNPWLKAPFQLYDLKAEIDALTKGDFEPRYQKWAWKELKRVLSCEVEVVIWLVEHEWYKVAICMLDHSIRNHIENWLVDTTAAELIKKVDLIISILQTLT